MLASSPAIGERRNGCQVELRNWAAAGGVVAPSVSQLIIVALAANVAVRLRCIIGAQIEVTFDVGRILHKAVAALSGNTALLLV